MMSAGWQSKTAQILSKASMGRCLTVPRQIAEIVGGRMPVRSASSFCVISLMASITFTLNLINAITSFPVLDYITEIVINQY